MAYFATALARDDGSWTARDVDLDDVADLDTAVDLLRDIAGDGPALLCVEENDEWFGVVRVDGDTEPRVFVSDARVIEQSKLAALLFADAPAKSGAELNEDEDEPSVRPAGEPAGDAHLLEDLGTPASTLLELCAEEGMLPADVIAAVCEKAGCLDALEQLREG